MGDKWNERCKCDCPKDAHIVTLDGGMWRNGYTDWRCTATIHDGPSSWPCRCSFLEKSMATGVSCRTCGSVVPLTESFWVGELEDDQSSITEAVARTCRYLEGEEHPPFDAASFRNTHISSEIVNHRTSQTS